MYRIKPVMQVNAISHIPILPQNLCVLLKWLGLGGLGNFFKENPIKMIQINEVVIDRKVWK
jgi:hypothetical protein